jgi:hypothetical protein
MLGLRREAMRLRRPSAWVALLLCCGAWSGSALGQSRRLWVLKAPDTIVEYDPVTFAEKGTVKVPTAALESPAALQVNAKGEMLFALGADDPTIDASKQMRDKVWLWDGKGAKSLGREYLYLDEHVGSNHKVTESLPTPYLSVAGTHLYWFTNQLGKLQRDNVDLEVATTFTAWRTDWAGKQREELATFDLPSCRCTTGACQETCTEARVWVPDSGVAGYFFLTRMIPGQTEPKFEGTYLYDGNGGSNAGGWSSAPLDEPLQRILDATDDGSFVVSAIPDIGCCGWENQSNDQTILYRFGKRVVIFDERARYKNPDYDVSFFTANAKIAPDLSAVAMTIEATVKPGAPIQLSEQGQANPQESERVRKVLPELPAVQVVSAGEGSKQIAYLPHASAVGWLNEKEIVIVEGGVLVVFTPGTGTRRKSGIKVGDAAWVFVR